MARRLLKWIGLGGLIVLVVLLGWAPRGFCEEQVTITTYFPAPYGVYKELHVDRMTVGLDYRDSANLSDGFLHVSNYLGVNIPPGFPASYGATFRQALLDVNGYAAVNDIYLNDWGKWLSRMGKKIITGNTNVMNLPPTGELVDGRYTILVWATYLTCEDYEVSLYVDSVYTATYYTGSDTDNSPGDCNRNTIMFSWPDTPAGSWTFSLDRSPGRLGAGSGGGLWETRYTWVAVQN